jgi:hypothetical protein
MALASRIVCISTSDLPDASNLWRRFIRHTTHGGANWHVKNTPLDVVKLLDAAIPVGMSAIVLNFYASHAKFSSGDTHSLR